MPDEPAPSIPVPGPEPAPPGPSAGLRGRTDLATILATEHWSLLGTRSMTWNEVMSRIAIHLTVTSALLVVLALVGQATGFGPTFWGLAIGFASAVLVMGTLTQVRVRQDRELIRAMNRLRRAYVNSLVAGALGGLIASVAAAPTVGVVASAIGLGLVWFIGQFEAARRSVRRPVPVLFPRDG